MANEKDFVKAIEPVLRLIFDQGKRIDALENKPAEQGPPGKDSDPDQVAEIVLTKHGNRIQGAPGQPGKDAPPPDEKKIAAELVTNPEFVAMCKAEPAPAPDLFALAETLVKHFPDQLRGPAGKDAEPVEIDLDDARDALMNSPEFVAMVKANPPDVQELAKVLVQEHGTTLKGEPGKDAEPAHVAELIKKDAAFVASIKGDPGERGEKGEPGDAGPPGSGIGAPRWQKGVYRAGVTVQHYLGHFYCAAKDTADEPGASPDWVRLGSAGFRVLDKALPVDEMRNGDIYPNAGGSAIWYDGKAYPLTMPGKAGDPGEKGAPGQNGKDAPVVVAGEVTDGALILALSDGSLLDCELKGFGTRLESIARDACTAVLDEKRSQIEARGVPLLAHRGFWRESTKYQFGDVVEFGNGVWVCKSATASARFNDADWQRIFSAPPAKKQRHAAPKVSSRIPGKKRAGENMIGAIEALDDGELNQFELHAWSAAPIFKPVIRLATFDPAMLIRLSSAHFSGIHVTNFTKQTFETVSPLMLFSESGFCLTHGALMPESKLHSQIYIDKRNPDFDVVTIESNYVCVTADMIGMKVNFWTEKENAISFIGFGGAVNDVSQWRAFKK